VSRPLPHAAIGGRPAAVVEAIVDGVLSGRFGAALRARAVEYGSVE